MTVVPSWRLLVGRSGKQRCAQRSRRQKQRQNAVQTLCFTCVELVVACCFPSASVACACACAWCLCVCFFRYPSCVAMTPACFGWAASSDCCTRLASVRLFLCVNSICSISQLHQKWPRSFGRALVIEQSIFTDSSLTQQHTMRFLLDAYDALSRASLPHKTFLRALAQGQIEAVYKPTNGAGCLICLMPCRCG